MAITLIQWAATLNNEWDFTNGIKTISKHTSSNRKLQQNPKCLFSDFNNFSCSQGRIRTAKGVIQTAAKATANDQFYGMHFDGARG